MKNETELQIKLKLYISRLEQIDAIKQQLKAILETVELIPGVKKRCFKSIALALYDAPGTIEERLFAMDDFIAIAFSKDDNRNGVEFTE